jgi:hypothetical protein
VPTGPLHGVKRALGNTAAAVDERQVAVIESDRIRPALWEEATMLAGFACGADGRTASSPTIDGCCRQRAEQRALDSPPACPGQAST